MISIILSVIAGIVLVAFHRARLKEVEDAVRREMTARLRDEQKAHQQFVGVLCDYIQQLSMERDAASEKAEVSYKRGRSDQQRENTDAAAWIKAYETQRVRYALKEGR